MAILKASIFEYREISCRLFPAIASNSDYGGIPNTSALSQIDSSKIRNFEILS